MKVARIVADTDTAGYRTKYCEIVEVDDAIAKLMIALGQAVPFDDSIVHRDPMIETRDPKVRRAAVA